MNKSGIPMKTTTVLNNVDHKDLKVNLQVNAMADCRVNRTLAYTPEIQDLHKEFPLLFYRHPDTQALQLHAILGLDKNENLFLDETGWRSRFVPAQLACGPFSIAYHQQSDAAQPQPFLCFNDQDERVNRSTGEPVFLPLGGESAYLQHVKKALQVIETGAQYDNTLFTLAEQMNLLEPVSVQIKLSAEHQVNFNDYLCINAQALSALSGEALSRLNQYGALSLLFFILSSMSNFQQLIDRKSAQTTML